MIRGLLWFVALGVAGYAIAFLLSDAVGDPSFHLHFRTLGALPPIHIAAGALALIVAPLQLSATVRQRWPVVHRIVGRLYVAAVLASSAAGFALALQSTHGVVAQTGFATLSVVWGVTVIQALLAIRAGDVPAHRAAMLRNVSLTFAAINLRLYMPLAMLIGLPGEATYAAVAWLCWVPNLLIAHRLARRVRSHAVRS